MIALFAKLAGWPIQVGASCCSWIVASTCFYNEPLFALHTSAKHLPNAFFSSPAFWRLTSFPRTEEPSGAKITDLGQSCLTLPLHDSRHWTSCQVYWKQRRRELRSSCGSLLSVPFTCTKGIKNTEVMIHMMSELIILIVANRLSSYVVLIWDLINPNTYIMRYTWKNLESDVALCANYELR